MQLKELATKPKLIKISLNSETILKAYGEPVDFWMYDRQDLPTFLKLAQVKEDPETLWGIVKQLIRNEDGTPTLSDADSVLPMEIMADVISETVAVLGNFTNQTSAT